MIEVEPQGALSVALSTSLATPRYRVACLLDGAAAIAHDQCPKIQRYHGGYSADNGGCALQGVIRNLKGEKFFVGLGDVNGISVREHYENIPPSSTTMIDNRRL